MRSDPARDASRERFYYVALGALALLLPSLPYLYGWWNTPKGDTYTGFTYNIDDSCVYLAWMRQAQEGHFFQRNLFTTEPQAGLLFNFLFLTLGNLVRLTRLPVMAVYQGARVVGGALTLWAFVALLREAIPQMHAPVVSASPCSAFLPVLAGSGAAGRRNAASVSPSISGNPRPSPFSRSTSRRSSPAPSPASFSS